MARVGQLGERERTAQRRDVQEPPRVDFEEVCGFCERSIEVSSVGTVLRERGEIRQRARRWMGVGDGELTMV